MLDEIRARCAEVATRRARHVRIEYEQIEAVADALAPTALEKREHDPTSHHLGAGSSTLAFFFTLDAVNFGSGWFPHLRKRPGRSGYFTVATSLKEQFELEGPWRSEELTALTPADCTRVFGQDPDDEIIAELMALFARALNDLGTFLQRDFGGRCEAVLEATDRSAESLVTFLTRMPMFRDVERYEDLEVPFYKRAQITAADLAIAFDGAGYGSFEDLHRLTLFADNLVPHVLRVDGVLVYDAALRERIATGEMIEAGCAEEVEIRACGVHAVELLVSALAARGRAVTAAQLDFLLWNRGQSPRYKSQPRHRCRTVSY